MAAASTSPAVYRRYTSAVYEDKYFPEKNAAIPFKWETTPGTPKNIDADHQYDEAHSADEYQHDKGNESDTSSMHNMIRDHSCTNYCRKDDHQYLHGSCIHIPHAVTVYPLQPPPKLSPVSRLHVKDLLHQAGHVGYHDLFDDEDDDHDHCPLHAYHHSFLRLLFPLRSIKASAVVPIQKNSVIEPRRSSGFDKAQVSALLVSGPSGSQGRSKSFSHSACMHREPTSKQANCKALVGASTLTKVSGRRCNSFNLQSAHHGAVIAQIKNDNDGDDNRSIAAAAIWTGACILAAAAAHNVVSGDHNHHNPCKVAMKLRDLMQQSANFSELELPSMTRTKNGGRSAIDENPAQLALCHAATTVSAKRRAKSMEEEVMEAFLGEGMMKSCTQEKDGIQDEPKREKATQANVDDDQPHKLVKSKGFFKLLKNECIACWCPSSTQY